MAPALTHQGHSRERLVSDALEFANAHGLEEHGDLFAKAAMVAQQNKNFASIPDLTEDERIALQYEKDHKWHGSKMLWFSVTLCAVGAATQGECWAEPDTPSIGYVWIGADLRLGPDRFKRSQLVLPRSIRYHG